MRARPLLRTIRLGPIDPSLLRELLLALFFLVGALAGHLCARSWDAVAQSALSGYLRDYCAVYDAGGVSASLGGCVLLYFGYTVLVFLLGFAAVADGYLLSAPVGVALIPALSGVFGFLTMYTVSAFVCCFGRQGAALAAGALLVRLLFTLPCFFAMAGAAWPLSTELAMLTFGRGRRSTPVLYGSRYFILFVLCVIILTLGVFCERLLTPLLFRLAMGGLAA